MELCLWLFYIILLKRRPFLELTPNWFISTVQIKLLALRKSKQIIRWTWWGFGFPMRTQCPRVVKSIVLSRLCEYGFWEYYFIQPLSHSLFISSCIWLWDKCTKKNVKTRATNLVMISNVYLPPKQPLVPNGCLSWHFRSELDRALGG